HGQRREEHVIGLGHRATRSMQVAGALLELVEPQPALLNDPTGPGAVDLCHERSPDNCLSALAALPARTSLRSSLEGGALTRGRGAGPVPARVSIGRATWPAATPARTSSSPPSCRGVNPSPATSVPSSTPVTGFSSPMSATVDVRRCARPANHA